MKMTRTNMVLAALLAGTVGVPADMFKPSIKDQISLGQKASKQIKKEEKVLPDDDKRVQEVRRIANKVIATIPEAERKKKPFEYSFDVIESKDLNAFALPGGPMFFYSGLLDQLKSEDEIAGIIAHEVTHVKNEHWASAYADNQKRQLGITAILMIFNANENAFRVASVSDALLFSLPYSRKHESEADRVGYDLALSSGYTPQGMINVFTLLKKSSGGGRSTEWMSDHPALDNRIKAIKDRLAKEKRTVPPETLRKTG
ncbi:MAG: M48 family metalloprotease [Chthonomonadaceae bacterium]|nr:M48 family metalloprotease [Chthonomonadaceae bacterium]